ncbi:tetratricopeptide repeat protein [uncultured Erythrobacter sp.]|uniref:tetratricopeptide repeat protein n=1 Tax=uncultured Erythrobacter sp. TaxID=263913 RepID=UPI002625BD75|nr:tetratricopeptide repeat protein [uncultured Erythrobacter sp.]
MKSDAINSNGSTDGRSGEGSSGSKAGWILLGAAAVLAAGSVGYNVYGSGESEPELAQSGDDLPSLEELRDAAEASDGDAAPWSELAFAHYERGEFGDAAEAYERAVAIDGGEAVLWSALGEARVYASERDPLPPEALEAFERAIELDPADPRARYFMAVKQDLEDDHEGAISSWLALLSDTPPGAPWESDLVRTIQQVGAINNIDIDNRLATVLQARAPEVLLPGSGEVAGEAASATVRGPTAQQITEASRMTPGEQQTMIAGMVEGLEARLENEPDDLDGWVMLMRSRMNLGEPAKAREALEKAIAANPDEAEELRRQAGQLGL